jgi:hypothetical protein
VLNTYKDFLVSPDLENRKSLIKQITECHQVIINHSLILPEFISKTASSLLVEVKDLSNDEILLSNLIIILTKNDF